MQLEKYFNIITFWKLFLIIINICYIIFKNFLINPMYYSIHKRFVSDHFFRDKNMNCDKFDPIYLMGEKFKRKPIIICKNKESSHICFKNSKYDYFNKVSRKKYGVICVIKNFVLDPLKSKQTNYIYKGPVDKINKGAPILLKGFFNMKCLLNELTYHRNKGVLERDTNNNDFFIIQIFFY